MSLRGCLIQFHLLSCSVSLSPLCGGGMLVRKEFAWRCSLYLHLYLLLYFHLFSNTLLMSPGLFMNGCMRSDQVFRQVTLQWRLHTSSYCCHLLVMQGTRFGALFIMFFVFFVQFLSVSVVSILVYIGCLMYLLDILSEPFQYMYRYILFDLCRDCNNTVTYTSRVLY